MDFPWQLPVDLGILAVALLIATALRVKIRFLRRFLIPNALTAGFLLLIFYNSIGPPIGVGAEGLGALVYHLLSISYIAMTLRKTEPAAGRGSGGIPGTAIVVISQFALQVLVGLLLTALFRSTVAPDLFPSFGLLLPLGFAQGPGQAYAIGAGWEAFGFSGAGTIGLTFAAIGFLWACFGGMLLVNHAIRSGGLPEVDPGDLDGHDDKTGVPPAGAELPVGARLTTESEAIDSMTFNFGVVLMTYLLCYLALRAATFALSFAGDLGRDLAANLWGLSFVFAALTALVVKRVMRTAKVDHTLDNGTLTRITGAAVDLMVAGAIGAISLVIVAEFWLPILIMSLVAGLIAFFAIPWLCARLFSEHRLQRTLIIYGAATGTMPTGLALLRVVDPQFETPAASDYLYQAPLTFTAVIPLVLALNLPLYSVTQDKPHLFWVMVGIGFAYLALTGIAFTVFARRLRRETETG